MTEIISENPQETSPNPSLAEQVAAWRAERDKKWAGAHEPMFSSKDRATMKNWSFQKKMDAAIRHGNKKMRAIRRMPRATPARRTHTPARVRARRSPASQRRATSDSGGTDGGGDPEPPRPRPRCNVSPIFCGGAL